ncbi:hypothetical protein KOR34_19300 [Posidoniimonas corsicana]|uniref:Glycosyl hydrolase family 65 central catalytic domain protein n=1 Tax=Posidoniimonas corsicana TaxID=1938618 RepID=A0A5C5VEC7_9BACT|nr:hypothetical protein [Posidoniimonas corsicana]TWT36984.1 hypothetical protein KOR34_19300 [Posidoniimonas corsicana]
MQRTMLAHTPRALRRGVFLLLTLSLTPAAFSQAIDRRALVGRHAINYSRYSPEAPASVGNGEFAYTFDITGMQTFPSAQPGHLPLATMAQWAWHRFPGSEAYAYEDTLSDYDAHGRRVSYATDMRSETATAIRSNPHRFSLGRVGLLLEGKDGARAKVGDLSNPQQTLDLWTGVAESSFEFDGQPVRVRTASHPEQDAVAFQITSPLVSEGRVGAELRFSYPSGAWGPGLQRWDADSKHTTTQQQAPGGYRISREMDGVRYDVLLSTDANLDQAGPHQLTLKHLGADTLQLVVSFRKENAEPAAADSAAEVLEASAGHWRRFWSNGGVVDLSDSSDPRWKELERRVVLSQYLTAINCAGSLPPQETGLLCNSWYGKSHLEMHWWHAAHFPLWGRDELLERSLGWYEQILPAARRIAERQGYAGVRWPKMTGPHGVSSPSEVGELLIWQQPHPIYFAELAYRSDPSAATLDRFHEIVEQTAEFMADYAEWDSSESNAGEGRYVLGPVLIPAQECYDGRGKPGVLNPTFELAYWRWALRTANEWRERQGRPANEEWAAVAEKIAPLPVRDGVYTAIENAPFTRRRDHPSMLGALGVMPEVGLVDRGTMSHTLDDVRGDWDWAETWGWDYPMMAMTAARLDRGADAVDCLLMDAPKNNYLQNGHCRQTDRLPIYLPANGGLLTAVGMMAAGWDSPTPLRAAPGFPDDGAWRVRHEGLRPMP